MQDLTTSLAYPGIFIPLLIFCARLLDMTLDTLRVIYVTRGGKYTAAILGFFQTLIWVFAISQVLTNLNGFMNAFAYAAGFSAGTFVGIYVEGKLALGKVMVRVITRKDARQLKAALQTSGFGLTSTEGEGPDGKVSIIYSVITKKHLNIFNDILKSNNPRAFVSISEVKEAKEEMLPPYTSYSNRFSWVQMWKR